MEGDRTVDPRVTPDYNTLLRQNETCRSAVTRSVIPPLSQMKPIAGSYDSLLKESAADCIAQVEKIVAACRNSKKKFFDSSFHYGQRNNMFPEGTPDDCTVAIPQKVERLSVLFPSAPLFLNGTEANDIVQGSVGDCFFIGAVAALAASTAQHVNPIGRLIVAAKPEFGVYGVMFFKNGQWTWVIIDDYIAIRPEDNAPLFASSVSNEVWPLILEKAYAKAHRCWDSIDGGETKEALADMCGGLETHLNFSAKGEQSKWTFDQFFPVVKNVNTVMGCSVDPKLASTDVQGSSGEAGTVYGLFKGHAYSIIDAVKAPDGKGFVRVRNPWGGDAEWTGAYSDKSSDWEKNPLHKSACKPEIKDDGAFWMIWEDFKKYFVNIDVCEYVDGNAFVACQFQKVAFTTNSADQTFILEILDPTGVPQGTLHSVALCAGQEDYTVQADHSRAKERRYSPVDLTLVPLTREPKDFGELSSLTTRTIFRTKTQCTRQVNEEVNIPSGFFSVRVHCGSTDNNAGYYLRVFSTGGAPIRLWRLDNKAATKVETGIEIAATANTAPVAPRGGKGDVVISVQPLTPAPPTAPADIPKPKPVALVFDFSNPSATDPVAPVAPAAPAVAPAAPSKPVVIQNDADCVPYTEERVIRGNGPEYIYRQPRCKPTLLTVSRKDTTFGDATTSFVKPMRTRDPAAATIRYLFQEKAQECIDMVNKIVQQCKQSATPFFDKTFYYSERRNLYPNGAPDDCTVAEPTSAARLSEIRPGVPLFDGRAHSNDIVQGSIGDCFLIGAIAAMAAAAESLGELDPLKRMFVASNQEYGVYGVMLFKNGAWEWVIIDDFVAVNPDSKQPLFADATGNEVWPMLLEKAYAKLHVCWDTIDGGLVREAFADLTGGEEYSAKTSTFTLEKFVDYVADPFTIIGCSVDPNAREQGGSGRSGEASAVFGLFKGHAYSVVDAKITSDGKGFVRVRNPWGGDAEWKGAYCDNGVEWKQNPLHFNEIKPNFAKDGCFWMPWDHFRRYFTDLELCKWHDPSSKCVIDYGVAGPRDKGITANQTFILRVGGAKADIALSLGQEDPKLDTNHRIRKNGRYATIQLSIYKLTRAPNDFNDLGSCLGQRLDTNMSSTRQVNYIVPLEPGLYSLAPRFSNTTKNVGFYVRAFASEAADLKLYRMDRADTVVHTKALADFNEQKPMNFKGARMPHSPGAASNDNSAQVTPRPPAPALQLKFSNLGQAVDEAVAIADPWSRGNVDEGLARQAFSRLLFRSDLGATFNELLEKSGGNLDRGAFKQLVAEALSKHQL